MDPKCMTKLHQFYAKKAGRVHEDQLKVCSWEVSHYFWRPPYLDYFRWQFFVHHHVRTICDYLMDSHHLKTHPLELLFSSGPSWCRVLHRWTHLFAFFNVLNWRWLYASTTMDLQIKRWHDKCWLQSYRSSIGTGLDRQGRMERHGWKKSSSCPGCCWWWH